MENCVPSLGMTRTRLSVPTIRKVAPVSSMTIPWSPTKDELREAIMERMIPVKSALSNFEAIDSSDTPCERLDDDGIGVGRGGRLMRLRR